MKYGNKFTYCLSKHQHQSKLEAQYCDQLYFLNKSGQIVGYAVQAPFPLSVNGQLICTHRVDFEVWVKGGGFEVHEVKGYQTPEWRLKYALFKALYPYIPYKIIKKERTVSCKKTRMSSKKLNQLMLKQRKLSR